MSHAIQSPPQVRFDEENHQYWLGETRLHSVSSIIRNVWPLKKSFDGKVDPQTLENARERGSLVDKYCCEYARTGAVDIPPNERLDVIERVAIFVDWWDKQVLNVSTRLIYDIKCTSQEEADWQYQLGAYGSMMEMYGYSGQLVDAQVIFVDPINGVAGTADLVIGGHGPLRLAVIHINPKRYSKGGLRIIPYDTTESIRRWGNIVQFWSDCRPWLDEAQRKSQKEQTA